MSIPKFNEFMPAFITCLADGAIHSLSEIRLFCADSFNLTEDERQMQLASGGNILADRVGWARTYLKKAGLIDSPERAMFKLTDRGIAAYKNGADKVTIEYLQQFEEFQKFNSAGKKADEKNKVSENIIDQSPQERLENALAELTASLADDLMTEIMKISPYDFEQLVVKLLIKMGYGSLRLNENGVTKKSGDEGIDGLVTSDRLGFDTIYIQAKQWKQDSVVGRPEIQRFLGALAGQGATKGLFITTTRFSSGATDYAEKQLGHKIILVDGEKLCNLMIEYDLGVSTVSEYKVKRIDLDFFNEGL